MSLILPPSACIDTAASPFMRWTSATALLRSFSVATLCRWPFAAGTTAAVGAAAAVALPLPFFVSFAAALPMVVSSFVAGRAGSLVVAAAGAAGAGAGAAGGGVLAVAASLAPSAAPQ